MEPGDQVLADSRFTIGDDIACYGASLIISAFLKSTLQLTKKEVEHSKQIGKVGIHVETGKTTCVTGALKNMTKYYQQHSVW